MDKDEVNKDQIIIHWWNGTTHEVDYSGERAGFLKLKNITVSNVMGKWHFKIPLASETAFLNTDSNYEQACDDAIQIFLLLLGDKATFETTRHKYYLNWRK